MRNHHKGRPVGRPDGESLSDGSATGRSSRSGAVGARGRSDDDALGRPGTAGRQGIASRQGTAGRHGVDVPGRRRVPGARRVSDALGVPMDIALNMPRMSFEGNARLVLDNHRGLVEYTPNHLQIDTPAGQIDITGRRLRIRGISRDQIVADGWFDRVEFSGWVGGATSGSADQEAP